MRSNKLLNSINAQVSLSFLIFVSGFILKSVRQSIKKHICKNQVRFIFCMKTKNLLIKLSVKWFLQPILGQKFFHKLHQTSRLPNIRYLHSKQVLLIFLRKKLWVKSYQHALKLFSFLKTRRSILLRQSAFKWFKFITLMKLMNSVGTFFTLLWEINWLTWLSKIRLILKMF